MRKLLAIIFVSGCLMSKAQTEEITGKNILLKTTLDKNVEAVATESITLEPGFSTNGYNFHARIERHLLSNLTKSKNYVFTAVPQKAYTVQELEYLLSEPDELAKTDDVLQNVTYYDGMGRAVEEIAIAQAPNLYDMISFHYYDQFGRESRQYKPFAFRNQGKFLTTYNTVPAYIQALFFDKDGRNILFTSEEDKQWMQGVGADARGYSQSVYDNSPLNRVVKEYGFGKDWLEHPMVNEFTNVEVGDEVLHFFCQKNSSGKWFFSTHTTDSYFADGLLLKTGTTDENGNLSEQFTDNQGKVLLKRNHNGTDLLDTYYIYDERDLLRFVISPLGTQKIQSNLTKIYVENDDVVKGLCFFYDYDARNRMITKRVPGAAPVYMVYDHKDRVILTQDGNLATKRGSWLFTKYDWFNRPVRTGIFVSAVTTQSLMQQNVDKYYEAFGDYYLDEVISSDGLISNDRAFPADPNPVGYGFVGGAYEIVNLTQIFYDQYGFLDGLGKSNTVYDCRGKKVAGKDVNLKIKGYSTGSYIRVLTGGSPASDDKWLLNVSYYDAKYRVVKSVNGHLMDGEDVIENKYDFFGRVTASNRVHGQGNNIVHIKNVFEYDHAGRPTTTKQQIGDGSEVILSRMDYNMLGELKTKNLHSSDQGSSYAQSVDYKYNIRGWLTHINNGVAYDDPNDKFGMELQYQNAPVGYEQYNGNIGKLIWKTKDANSQTFDGEQAYEFTYDGLNRLKKATYSGQGLDFYSVGGDDGGKIRYDHNGNIKSLSRYQNVKLISSSGQTTFSKRLIDDLSYSYANANQLSSVSDLSTETERIDKRSGMSLDQVKDIGFRDGARGAEEYVYDANGNMIKDDNKGILGIEYNHLNLPSVVTMTDSREIRYVYTTSGTKLQKIAKSGENTTVRNYINGIEYDSQILQQVSLAEGRYLFTTNAYQYNLTDHLGNVRVTLDASGSVIQRDDYYPFGLTFNSYTSGTENLYKYNGKEEQKETGFYDYGARFYDPALMRWNHIDPLANEYYSWTPYNYALNNPIKFVDPDGRAAWIPGKDGKAVSYKVDDNGNAVWSENATSDTKRIGNSMLRTETGTKQLNLMINSETKVNLKLSGETKISKNPETGKTKIRYGETKLSGVEQKADGTMTAKEATVTVFEGTIETVAGQKNDLSGKAGDVQDVGAEAAIGAVAAHESVHAVDPTNVNQNLQNQVNGTNHDIESVPDQVEKQVIDELKGQ